jgi:hypothetical protein
MAEAPDLTLRLRDYGLVSILNSDVLVRPRPTPMGMHRPEGIFMARGPHIRKGVALEQPLRLIDVAPLLLHALDAPVPVDLEGRLPGEVFDPAWLAEHPVRVGAPTEIPEPLPLGAQTAEDVEGEQEVMARLRALGYVE